MRALRRLTAYGTALLMTAAAGTAEPFAPGIISTPQHGCITFAPDGKTAYFAQHTPSPARLMISHFENNTWTAPQYLPFSGPDSGRQFDGDPTMSQDGSRLFFMSQKDKGGPVQVWSATREGEKWSEPKPVADGGCGPSVANDGTLYFCAKTNDTRGGTDMYRARLVNGVYTAPENLGDAINGATDEYDAFIAPDQSYLIFTRVMGPGKKKFFVSENTSSGWSPAQAIEISGEDVYKEGNVVCPVVSPDGLSFFYTGGGIGTGGIYRVDTASLLPKRKSWSNHFVPGIISEGTGGITFTPDGNTAYFGKRGTIMVSHTKNGKWSTPDTAPFSGKHPEGDPSISPDGSRLYYWSRRPATGKPKDGWWPDLWYVERKDDGWSEPKSVGGGPNGEWSPFSLRTGTPSQAADGTLYFFRCTQDPCGETRIVRSKPKNGRYVDYEDLGDTVNGKTGGFDLAIAPDQSFIVFCAKRPDSIGDYDIYISYQKDGAWSEPRNLGPKVNSMGGEYSPSLSPDGKRLFFAHYGIHVVEMADILGK